MVIPILIYTQFYHHQPFIHLLPVIIPISYIVAFGIFRLDQLISKKSGLKCGSIIVIFSILFLSNFILISYEIEPYYPEGIGTDFDPLNYEFRHSPREEDYKTIFKAINEYDKPHISLVTHKERIDKMQSILWPIDKNAKDKVNRLKESNVIQNDTTFEDIIYPNESITNVTNRADILIILASKELEDSPEHEFRKMVKDLKEYWTKIDDFSNPHHDSHIWFYEK